MGVTEMASPLNLPWVGRDVYGPCFPWLLLLTKYPNMGIFYLCCGSQAKDGFAKGKNYYFIVEIGPKNEFSSYPYCWGHLFDPTS